MAVDARNFRDRAAQLARRINDISDVVTERIKELEDELNRWNLGVSAFVEDDPLEMQLDDKGGLSLAAEELDYTKLNGRWGLVARSVVSGQANPYAKARWLRDCPRDLRLNAIDLMPQLIAKLLDAAETRAAEAEERARRANDLVAGMRTPGAAAPAAAEPAPTRGKGAAAGTQANAAVPPPMPQST